MSNASQSGHTSKRSATWTKHSKRGKSTTSTSVTECRTCHLYQMTPMSGLLPVVNRFREESLVQQTPLVDLPSGQVHRNHHQHKPVPDLSDNDSTIEQTPSPMEASWTIYHDQVSNWNTNLPSRGIGLKEMWYEWLLIALMFAAIFSMYAGYKSPLYSVHCYIARWVGIIQLL